VRIRPGGYEDEPDDLGAAEGPADQASADHVSYVVPTRVIVVKFAVAALLVVLALVALGSGERSQSVIGLVVASAVAVYAARDLVARERLRADPDGVVAVRGYAGHRRLAWSEIERVRVDARTRFGASTELLEVDAGEEIYLFSRHDLGVDPTDAAEALEAVRSR
jgi:hypothetical protein